MIPNDMISVIVPIYNAAKYLPRCIESIVNQSYKNLEIILVNDGSTDQSLEICQGYAKQFDNIILINKPNEGVSIARSVGLKHARGCWVSFVDSDDFLSPHAYELLLKKVKNDNTKVVMLANYTVKKAVFSDNCINSLTALRRLCHMEYPTSMWAGMYARELIANIALPGDIHFFEDFLFNYQVLHLIDTVSLCYDAVYNYSTNEGSINRQPLNRKRMSCIKIIPLLLKDGEFYNEQLSNDVNYCISHFLACNIAALSLTHKDDTLFKELKAACKKYRTALLKARNVPLSYKLAIFMTSISANATAFMFDIKGLSASP